jgi:predicted DNA-binding protein
MNRERKAHVTFRVSPEIVDRLDELVIQAARRNTIGTPTRSDLARAAIERGIEILEKELKEK